jgi:hypothetical protein
MRLGEILLERRLVTANDISAALERQRTHGGRLGENLTALGALSTESLASVMHETPAIARTVAETGISAGNLRALMLKLMEIESCETVASLAARMRISQRVVQELMDESVKRGLVQGLGSVSIGILTYVRYSLGAKGHAAAAEAIRQNLYIGPAPVALAAWQRQIDRQRISNELLDPAALRTGVAGMVFQDRLVRKLLPAINAGRTVLLFGPPGNGKTSIASRIASLFRMPVYIPYAVEVDGQIVKIFDAGLHEPISHEAGSNMPEQAGLELEGSDDRWVLCKRPFAVAGGELSLEMLDLQCSPETRFYDAPLHVKALNGVFVIDDFGRQKVEPRNLLNRWIVPMENRVEYLKLNTGKSFSLPFDELLIFSTNLHPSDLMDPAYLRRIPYKVKVLGPDRQGYRQTFERAARAAGLELTNEVFEAVVDRLTRQHRLGLAYFQPKFICDQVIEASRSFGVTPVLTKEAALEALANLYVEIEEAMELEGAQL